MRSITINTSLHEPFEIGALLCATLAFPLLTEVKARQRAAHAWCAKQVAATVAASPSVRNDFATLFPAYTLLSATGDGQALRTSRRRFRDRMIAARMMRAHVTEALTKQPATLPLEMQRLSINELAKFVRSETGEHDPENVERRVWRPSRPVIHLAAAFDLFFALFRPGTVDGYDLQNLDHHRTVVQLATILEQILLADKRLQLPRQGLLRLRWIE